jgi:hypothetical protein
VGIPQLLCGIATLRVPLPIRAGPPNGPTESRVSRMRQGVVGTKRRPVTPKPVPLIDMTAPDPVATITTAEGEDALRSVNCIGLELDIVESEIEKFA